MINFKIILYFFSDKNLIVTNLKIFTNIFYDQMVSILSHEKSIAK